MKLLFLLGLLSTASAAPPAKPLNLIMISLGNVGTKHMSLYGYSRPTTPGLALWAKEAALFESAHTPASWTLPVAATAFTGLSPRQHGVQSRFIRNRLNPAVPTLAEILSARGWATAAFTGGLDYDPGFGHMRGFQTIARNRNFEQIGVSLAEAGRWLKRRAKPPFFLFAHGYDSHCPFLPAAPFRGAVSGNPERTPGLAERGPQCGRSVEASTRSIRIEYATDWCRGMPDCPVRNVELTRELEQGMIDGYDDTLRQIDTMVSNFLTALPPDLVAGTVILIYGDHGEMFAKNGRFGRQGPIGGVFYEDVLRVPLLIKVPGLPARRIKEPVELAMLPATILELLGVADPARPEASPLPGAAPSFLPALQGRRPPQEEAYSGLDILYGEGEPGGLARLKKSEIDAVLDGRLKLIRELSTKGSEKRLELYDLVDDPEEGRNLVATRPAEAERLESMISGRRKREDGTALPPQSVEIRENIRRSARMAGYW